MHWPKISVKSFINIFWTVEFLFQSCYNATFWYSRTSKALKLVCMIRSADAFNMDCVFNQIWHQNTNICVTTDFSDLFQSRDSNIIYLWIFHTALFCLQWPLESCVDLKCNRLACDCFVNSKFTFGLPWTHVRIPFKLQLSKADFEEDGIQIQKCQMRTNSSYFTAPKF